MLSAELRGDEQEWRRLSAIDCAGGGWSEVMPIATAMAAQQVFRQYDLRLVTVFVRRFLDRDGQPGEFSAAAAEALLRGLLGDESLLASVDPGLAGRTLYALLFALVDELELSDQEADGLLHAAEQQASREVNEGRSTEAPPGAPGLPEGMHRRTRRRYLTDDEMSAHRIVDGGRRSTSFGDRRSRKRERRSRLTAHVMPSTLAGRLVSASMLRQSAERERIRAILEGTGKSDITRMTRAAFEAAVRRQFQPRTDLREIGGLVAATRAGFYSDLDVMGAEFLVRAALGERVPDPDMDARDEMLTMTLVLGALADWWDRDEPTVHAVIVQAESNLADAGIPLALSED